MHVRLIQVFDMQQKSHVIEKYLASAGRTVTNVFGIVLTCTVV
jgi:hypothetical protein